MWSIKFVRWQGALGVLVVAALSFLVSVPAVAGPTGAAGDVYVIGSYDGGLGWASPAVIQYDGATGARVDNFVTLNGGQFNGMAWSPNGNLFITQQLGLAGKWRIKEFDGQTGDFIQTVVTYNVGDFSVAKGLAFGPDGDLFVGDWAKGTVNRYDGTSFELEASTASGGIGTPNGMRFAPNGNLMVVSGGFNSIQEYDVSMGGIAPVGTFATVTGSMQAQDLDFGPNGNLFVSLGSVGGVSEFNGVTGASLGQFVPMDSSLPVNGLAFDNFDRLLVSAIVPNNRVDAYDAMTGSPLGPFLTDGFGDIGVGEDSVPTIISVKPIPEPAAFALLLVGGAMVAVKRRGFGG